jgi:hypothetical protein
LFNLLVKYSGWAETSDRIPAERLFEYTDEPVVERFRRDGQPDFESLLDLPAVFVQETSGNAANRIVRIGTILRARIIERDISLQYVYDPTVPSLTNEELEDLDNELAIGSLELTRTHWAVKDADLFRTLMRRAQPRRHRPRVFNLADPESIEPSLVSAMMPFAPAFDAVYSTLQSTAESVGLRCRRADDIWENPAIIQDVVSLIDRSRVVICDCTGRNPNVFYEIGIAHTIGREVILITQSDSDIPFDLRHLRYVKYLNNGEGREELGKKLAAKLEDLVGTRN